MAPGVPKNADPMQNAPSPSVLTLQFEVVDDNPDWPDLVIRVDGQDPFAGSRSAWRGFDPARMLGDDCPLIPTDFGRRVAVARCGCGEAGCGALAPLIVASADGRRISWLDARDFVGIFSGPVVAREIEPDEGRPKDLPDLHFDREQYLAEVERVRWDRSWETPRRRLARLVGERLRPLNPVLPPNLAFRWASPAWSGDGGVTISFERWIDGIQEGQINQQLLKLTSSMTEPEAAAEDMVQQLLAVPPERWSEAFGYRSC